MLSFRGTGIGRCGRCGDGGGKLVGGSQGGASAAPPPTGLLRRRTRVQTFVPQSPDHSIVPDPVSQGFFRIIKNQGGGGPPPQPPPPPDQSDHSGKKRNLQKGKSGQAIFGTPSFGSKAPSPPPPLPPPLLKRSPAVSPWVVLGWVYACPQR